MKKSTVYNVVVVLCFAFMISGCASTSGRALRADESQVELRAIQTRVFDTADKERLMRTIITTMQDLDFVIDKADLDLGTVTGSKFFKGQNIQMTVTVRPKDQSQFLVRASARAGVNQVKDPETYQDFFVALEKSMFLTAHKID